MSHRKGGKRAGSGGGRWRPACPSPDRGDETPAGEPDRWNFTAGSETSDTYSSLPELLEYLSGHDTHGEFKDDAAGTAVMGEADEARELTENTGVAVSCDGRYAYHLGEEAVEISRLAGEDTENAGSIPGRADALFVCGDSLITISQFVSGGDELSGEISVQAAVYDISSPTAPELAEEYVQGGSLTACYMAGDKLYLVTGDGVCACGWSRLEDTAGYYPSLTRGGETVEWGDEDISILGEPTRVQYAAITVIDGNTGELAEKEALYGNIQKIFYGPDYIAMSVAGETDSMRENPVLYTLDASLNFTGKISPAEILNAPASNALADGMPHNGDYIEITSAVKAGDIYRILGTYTVRDGENEALHFMAATADPGTGEAGGALLFAEDYPHAAFTEILWEEERAICCVRTGDGDTFKTQFLLVDFDGLEAAFRETGLTADYLDGRVGVSYGNPLGNFETLIPLGGDIYVRYSHMDEGPGGFDVFRFPESGQPELVYRADTSLAGADAFDYVWHVYDDHTFGTLKVLLGEEDYFRDVELAWCVYSVNEGTPVLVREQALTEIEGAYLGADSLGLAVFEAGSELYCVTRNTDTAAVLD